MRVLMSLSQRSRKRSEGIELAGAGGGGGSDWVDIYLKSMVGVFVLG
jgi:hypothetical protein